MRYLPALVMAVSLCAQSPQPDWSRIDQESLSNFQALVRLDTTSPPGNEIVVVEYLKQVLDREGIPYQVFALDPKRPNLVARIKGNGSKRPLLILGHTDTVSIDSSKWRFPPFGATRDGGYIYGRGTVDDKDNLTAALMSMILIKRLNVPLDRDVIFLAESGEEGDTKFGIGFMVDEHLDAINAEFAYAEGGGVTRENGKVTYAAVQTTEKSIISVQLTSNGPAGHASMPLQGNALAHLAKAVGAVADWQVPMRLNDTTRTYFERLATISPPLAAARYNGLTNPVTTFAVQQYFAASDPRHNSMIRTTISPTIFNAGYRVNVIPSEAIATIDVRAVPDEPLDDFFAQMERVINDPVVKIVNKGRTRPLATPSPVNSEPFRVLESTYRKHYNAVTLPQMGTGGTDMSFLRSKGIASYGIGPAIDAEDGPLGFGAHSDQERILESELLRFVRFHYDAVLGLAASKP